MTFFDAITFMVQVSLMVLAMSIGTIYAIGYFMSKGKRDDDTRYD